MMIKRLDDGKHEGYSRKLYTLKKGEHQDTAGSTKKAWHGPGSFVRTTWPDGGREDSTAGVGGPARLGGLPQVAS